VVGIDGVSKTEGVCQEGDAKKNWRVIKREKCPNPGANVYGGQKPVKPDHLISKAV
jgi:hypothetical protein